MEHQKRLEAALEAISQKIPVGGIFELRELFGEEWEREPFGVRTDFGKFFAREVAAGRLPNIEKADGGKNNHRVYRRRG